MTTEEKKQEIARLRERIAHLTAVVQARGFAVSWTPPDEDGLEHLVLLPMARGAGGASTREVAARIGDEGGAP
jgi:hypothetical protein